MKMLKKSLIEFIFEAASIERWNDHIRPSRGFSELDKQSHKMIYAYILAKIDGNVDMDKLIEGGIFEFFHRLVLTDIKPPVFHKLMKKMGRELNRWALDTVKPNIINIPHNFYQKMETYFMDKNYAEHEKRILEAAHYLATKWEFDIIYDMCRNYYGIDSTRAEIDNKLNSFRGLKCFDTFIANNNYRGFTGLLGELRFQQRWSRSPRIPETSVIGHMLIVAILAYLCSCETNACAARITNNFIGGLFHDIPEVLTRDIVSPVKNSVKGLDEIIKGIEQEQMQSILYPLIPDDWQKEIEYYTNDEFSNKIMLNDKAIIVSFEDMDKKYNSAEFKPVDGELIRGCDHLAACIETYFTHIYGITTNALQSGNRMLRQKYDNAVICGVEFGSLFDYFGI